ncbi:MAG: alpha/beta fold hydrolase [Labilithrix sp.]|nr:alpha/beta fold hydrolase [Labilithrix sp.]MCW5818189.1 alpha/beta fold hydrolase [Labilithrix sp.]
MSDDGFEHRTIDAGEVRLHVAEARPANAGDDTPLVVFLHGFPEFWWSWRHQLTALRDAGYWAVAPDMRGYGGSDKPWEVGAYEIERLAGDVAGLIRALGREKAFVVGHDWGAVVAWAFAMEHPDLLDRLAILNVPHPLQMLKGLRTLRQLMKSWYMFFFQLPKVPELSIAARDHELLRKTFAADGVPSDEIERYVEAFRVPGVARSSVNYYRAAIRRVVTGRTPKMRPIDRPTLVVWGDRDRFLGKELAEPPPRFVPNARTVHIPEATHWVQRDAPARVNELLLEHFGDQGSSR